MSYTEEDYNKLTELIISCAIDVHKELGPGLLESVYEVCLVSVMRERGLKVKSQVSLPIYFRGEELNKNFIIDVLVNDLIILELKSIEAILPIHEAQLVTYLKLADKKLGLLINFNVPLLKDGVRRRINGYLNERNSVLS
ncbi:MAG: GxxExxY protein [Bacteroidetes bacterium]|nr:GxxExxY protein [Bacteroidota bacterium]